MTDVLVVEELESLVDVLEYPSIRLHVEGCHIVMEIVGVFEDVQPNVRAASPILDACLLVSRDERES